MFPQGSAIYLMTNDATTYASLMERTMSIGYMPVGYAKEKGLMPVHIDNRDGIMMDPYTADANSVINITEFPASPLEDYKGLNFIYRNGHKSYPLSLVSYMWVRRDIVHLKDAGALLKAFIKVILGEEAQNLLPGFGFFKLAPELLAFSSKVLDMLYIDPDVEPFVFETDTALTGVGAGARVLSSMRSSITAYEMQQIYTAIERASETIDEELTSLMERLDVLEATKYPDTKARGTASAGLAFALFGAVMACVNLWLLFMCLLARRRVLDNFNSNETDEAAEKGADKKSTYAKK